MKRAAAINEFINLRAFCAIVDSLVAKDDSPKSSHSEVLEQLVTSSITWGMDSTTVRRQATDGSYRQLSTTLR
jgi:hypothetical protein